MGTALAIWLEADSFTITQIKNVSTEGFIGERALEFKIIIYIVQVDPKGNPVFF